MLLYLQTLTDIFFQFLATMFISRCTFIRQQVLFILNSKKYIHFQNTFNTFTRNLSFATPSRSKTLKLVTTQFYRSLHTRKKMSTADFVIPNSVPICKLDCSVAFNGLSEREKKYAHFLSNACNEGALVVLLQTSPESPAIFMLLQLIFEHEDDLEQLKVLLLERHSLSDDDFQAFLTYAAGFYSNMGNYKSFGDSKILPAIPKDKMQSLVLASKANKKCPGLVKTLWDGCSNAMYSLGKRVRELGLGEKGLSTYYSSNITEGDIAVVQEFMGEKKLSPYNTRLFKLADKKYELRHASVETGGFNADIDDPALACLGVNQYKEFEINVTRGDYSHLMKRVVTNLEKAKEFASNENEQKMLENYAKSFQTGSINAHKDGSRFWVKDKGPIVENYIGFIESYRDPYGVRGEFEGFVSIVNKEMSAKFGILVENAENFLKLLPWTSDYEKNVFLRPDFTSLDVLIFGGSGIPAGINIPNYDDIRQDEGFKNVSLGNVLQAHTTDQKVTFLTKEDAEMYGKLKGPSFEVQVGLHELLGHGSGKLFSEKEDGSLNFDVENVKNLETDEKITSWYKNGETWDTKFSTIASTYEECRAESVGLHLCLDKNILKIFGHEGSDADDIIYINWLNMVRAGLLGLEFYSPENNAWKQAHMNARYVILQVLREVGEGLVKIEECVSEDGQPDLVITLDRSKVDTVGRKAISNFLMRLQVYKSTADYETGQKMYAGYSSVNEEMLAWRKIVLARKQPRRIFVQSNTEIVNGDVSLQEFEANIVGVCQSFSKRYPQHDAELEELWKAEQKFHEY